MISFLVSMFIFGTIGIFRRFIELPSGILAMGRGYIGMLFILVFLLFRREKLSSEDIRANLKILLLSGGCIGINWILLFEAYAYTSVAVATLCYYMQPVFVILASPLILKEPLNRKKVICVLCALLGMAFVSGALESGPLGRGQMKGVCLALGAALLYASVILLNKKLKNIGAFDRTVVQLGSAATVLLPYIFLTGEAEAAVWNTRSVLMLIVVGIIHTGLAYTLYFGAVGKLSGQSVALLSYVDPVTAIILSALLLHEHMGVWQAAGAVLILGAAIVGERQ